MARRLVALTHRGLSLFSVAAMVGGFVVVPALFITPIAIAPSPFPALTPPFPPLIRVIAAVVIIVAVVVSSLEALLLAVGGDITVVTNVIVAAPPFVPPGPKTSASLLSAH